MPQPIDMQTELARVHVAERIQQIADRASLAGQHRQEIETEQTRIARETQVQETPQPESEQVEAEGKRRNPFAKRRRKQRAGKDDASGGAVHREGEEGLDRPGRHFDVTV
jgi:hypothetical protein